MNTNKYIVALAALAGLSAQANAQEKAKPQFPYIAPLYCKQAINIPEGASVFYRSENCQTVFVLPPEVADLDYKVSLDAINDGDCDDLAKLRLNRRKLHGLRMELLEKAMKPGVSDAQIKNFERQIAMAEKSLEGDDKAIKSLGGLEGARMSVQLAGQQVQEVERFFKINKDAFRDGTNFEPIQVAESYVSFSVGSENAPDTRPAVVRTEIPGIQVRGVESSRNSDTRIMNGSVSGAVYLGLNAVCNMRENENVSSVQQIQFAPENMEAYIPANLTYSVAVNSSYSIKASLDYTMIVNDIFKQIETRPDKFTVNFIKDEILNASGSQAVKWEFTAHELQDRGVTVKDLKDIEEREKAAILAGWARDLGEVLVKMKVLEKLEPTPIPAPPAGTEEETHFRRMCRSKSAVGIRYSHKCWDEPYRVIRNRGGSADNLIKELRTLNMKFSVEERYSTPIFRTHTSTFKYRPKR